MHPNHSRRLRLSLCLIATALLGACASTRLTDSWFDPTFSGGPFQKWIVVAAGGGPVSVRTLEDTMTAKLRARGVAAVQGYRFLPDGAANQQQLDAAVTQSGAEALMLVHLRRVETRTQVSTTMVPAGVGGFGWWGPYGGWVAVPDVSTYQIAMVETMVYKVAGQQLVWSGVTQTFDPGSTSQEAPAFSTLILDSLAAHALVPPAKG
ncbi:MAG: hypothetical protein JSR18_04105 [Proteobacteria bacterium]|nr:hypothetical protein [Pseudomonadota bacterium]